MKCRDRVEIHVAVSRGAPEWRPGTVERTYNDGRVSVRDDAGELFHAVAPAAVRAIVVEPERTFR